MAGRVATTFDEPAANGHATKDEIHARLTGEPLTEGYRPSLPPWAMYTTQIMPQFFLMRDIELMMTHPLILNYLNYFKSGLAGAEFEVTVGTQTFQAELTAYIQDHCQRFWSLGMPKLQGGYEYGWMGAEPLYHDENGYLAWNDLRQFSPRDVWLLTQEFRPIGVRVRQIKIPPGALPNIDDHRTAGQVDLWSATKDVPAKGVWYAHNPRYSPYYGQSQLLGAWRPWRRLAWQDGAETNIDGAFYRYFYAGISIGYPEEDILGQAGSVGTTNDSQGKPRRFARDMARELAEYYKAGAIIGVPSTKYPQEMGGGDKWWVKYPENTLDVTHGVAYVNYLAELIALGIGVSPELVKASESGSGYSGRSIPMEGFMYGQQKLADAMLRLFMEQILAPLIRWNWGEVAWTAKVANLLETKRKMQAATQDGKGSNAAPEGQRQPGPDASGHGGSTVPGQNAQPFNTERPGGNGPFSLHPALITDRIREIARLSLAKRAA